MIKIIDTKATECEILSLLLNDQCCRQVILSKIDEYYFTDKFHIRLYKAIKSLELKTVPLDLQTIITEMQTLNIFENGDITNISNIKTSFCSAASLDYHLDHLIKSYKSNECKKKMYNYVTQQEPVEINSIISDLSLLDDNNCISTTCLDLQDKFLLDLENRLKSDKIKPLGTLTGFRGLDSITRGIVPGSIVTIQARSGVGKTSFNIQLAQSLAKNKNNVCYFSLEVTAEQLNLKMILAESNISLDEYLKITATNNKYEDRLVHASNTLATLNLRIEEETNLDKILALINYHIRKNNVKIFFIDYLNIVNILESSSNTDILFNIITSRLKQVALKNKIIIFLVVQSNRETDKRQDKRPTLADIKSSSSIEQNSDYIITLYRNLDFNDKEKRQKLFDEGKVNYNVKNADFNPDCFELIVQKNRHAGLCGTTFLKYSNNCFRDWY